MKFLGFTWFVLWELLVGLAAAAIGDVLGIIVLLLFGGSGLIVAWIVVLVTIGHSHPPGV